MKKCKKCGANNQDDAIVCNFCGEKLEKTSVYKDFINSDFYRTVSKKFHSFNYKTKKIIILSCVALAFILGFSFHYMIGVKRSYLREVLKENAAVKDKNIELNNKVSDLSVKCKEYEDKISPYNGLTWEQIAEKTAVMAENERKAKEEEALKKAAEEQAAAERAELIKEQKMNSYDVLQKLYLDVNQDMDYDTALNRVKETGLLYKEHGNKHSKRIRIAYIEDGTKEYHSKGDYVSISFERNSSDLSNPLLLSCVEYYNDTTHLTAINLISGSYWSLNEPGLYIKNMTETSTEYSKISQINKVKEK